MRGAKNVFMTETPRPKNPVHLSVAAQQQQTLSDPNLSCLSRLAHPIPPQNQGSSMPFHPAGIRRRVKGPPQFPWLGRWVWGHPRSPPPQSHHPRVTRPRCQLRPPPPPTSCSSLSCPRRRPLQPGQRRPLLQTRPHIWAQTIGMFLCTFYFNLLGLFKVQF